MSFGMTGDQLRQLSDEQIVKMHADYCGCHKAPGMVGNHGMHWWVMTRRYLESDQFNHFMREDPKRNPADFRYSPAQETMLGQLAYIGPCPAYRAAASQKEAQW